MAVGSLSPGAAKACEAREKYWSEIDDKEKIKRLRQIVKQQQGELRRLSNLVDMLANHEHGKLGQILSPLLRGGYHTLSGPREDKDEVYF